MSSQTTRKIIPRKSLWDVLGYDIFELVLQRTSRADLRALSLVSKDSRASAEPFLYSRIEWTWLKDQTPPIAAFLRTILRRPELAAHVRSVVLLGHTFYEAPFNGDLLPLIPTAGLDLDDAVEAIETTRLPYASRWGEALRRGTMDAFVALLLSQLHYLTHLVLGPNFTKDTGLLGMLLTSALCEKSDHGLSNFRQLREVIHELEYDTLRDMRGRNTVDILPFFYLPEVQRLSVALDNPVTLNWPAHTPDPSILTTLDLTYVRETHLSRVLSVTRALKTLRWAWFYSPNFKHSSNTSLIDLDEVATALISVRNTLKELTIIGICVTGQDPDLPFLQMKGSLNALADFNQLEMLEIPMPFLAASFTPDAGFRLEDVVPRNIRSLLITDDFFLHEQEEWDDTAVFGVVESWLGNWRVSNPKLSTISLLLYETDEYWGPAMREEFRKLCAECGVGVEIRKKRLDV